MGAWKPNWDLPAGSGERWPDDYERGRPGWPAEVVDVPGLPPTATALELAAGTGKLTRLLTATFARVLAAEPAEAMRRRLVASCPTAEVIDASAESIPLPDGTVDAVFAAEAFHHFDAERALREIARVLRPAGAIVLLWNVPAGPWEPSIAPVEEILDRRIARLGALSYDPLDLGGPRRPFSSDFEVVHVPNRQKLDRDGLVAFFASMGWIADIPDEERLPLLEDIRALLTADAYERQWTTHVHWTKLG